MRCFVMFALFVMFVTAVYILFLFIQTTLCIVAINFRRRLFAIAGAIGHKNAINWGSLRRKSSN